MTKTSSDDAKLPAVTTLQLSNNNTTTSPDNYHLDTQRLLLVIHTARYPGIPYSASPPFSPNMSSHVVVLDSTARRATIKTSPTKPLADILQEACTKLGADAAQNGLK